MAAARRRHIRHREWNGRGVAFCCFMLAATLLGSIPPIRQPALGIWNPRLGSLPPRPGPHVVEMDLSRARRARRGGS